MMGNRWLGQIKVLGNFQNCHFPVYLQKFNNLHPVFDGEAGKTPATTGLKFHHIDNNLYVSHCQEIPQMI